MKKKCIVLLHLVLVLVASAQEKASLAKHQFKINLLAPGFVYEHGFDAKNSLYSVFEVGVGYRSSNFLGNGWYFFPTIIEQYRHYYNLDKRIDKGKSIFGNSGGYYGLVAGYQFKSLATKENLGYFEPAFILGPTWGFQKTYKHRLSLNLDLGLTYNLNIETKSSKTKPLINFRLGWKIGK